MKIIYGTLLLVSIALLGVYAWKPIRLKTYFLPASLKTGWVTIEYENPKCAPLREGRLWQEHVIPESGYLCTSSQRETGWSYTTYYLVQPNELRRLLRDEEIFHEASISFGTQKPECIVIASSFWYGPQGGIDNQQFTVLESLHPECTNEPMTPISYP
jgi:hypothetical protein